MTVAPSPYKPTLLNRLRAWLDQLERDNLARRFGGIQQCPWCRQIAQSGEGWDLRAFAADSFLDVLTCGVCGGKSLWHFGHGMHYFGPLASPQPLLSDKLSTFFEAMSRVEIKGPMGRDVAGNEIEP